MAVLLSTHHPSHFVFFAVHSTPPLSVSCSPQLMYHFIMLFGACLFLVSTASGIWYHPRYCIVNSSILVIPQQFPSFATFMLRLVLLPTLLQTVRVTKEGSAFASATTFLPWARTSTCKTSLPWTRLRCPRLIVQVNTFEISTRLIYTKLPQISETPRKSSLA